MLFICSLLGMVQTPGTHRGTVQGTLLARWRRKRCTRGRDTGYTASAPGNQLQQPPAPTPPTTPCLYRPPHWGGNTPFPQADGSLLWAGEGRVAPCGMNADRR